MSARPASAAPITTARTMIASTVIVAVAVAIIVAVAITVVAGVGPLTPAPAQAAPAPPLPCLLPPVLAPIVDPFREPACPYCAGNRGIELAPTSGTTVGAGADGRVTFAGLVARTRYVVIEHRDGFRTTYGNLATTVVTAGRTVRAGDPVGTSAARLHFGLRHGERYLDPLPALASVRVRPQLVPLDGRNRRPPRPAAVSCPVDGGGGGRLR